MILPPCKLNGIECERRYIGCRANCEAYHEWLAKHNAEKEQMAKAKSNELDVDRFLVTQGERKRKARNREYMREYMKGR